MDNKQFDDLCKARLEKTKAVLCEKAKEYAQEDRLHNFKVAARMNDESPEQALWGMVTKHLVSVMDMVAGRLEITPSRIDEKIGDCINYFILLEALMIEKWRGMVDERRSVLKETLQSLSKADGKKKR